jgi:hypothetical protein
MGTFDIPAGRGGYELAIGMSLLATRGRRTNDHTSLLEPRDSLSSSCKTYAVRRKITEGLRGCIRLGRKSVSAPQIYYCMRSDVNKQRCPTRGVNIHY